MAITLVKKRKISLLAKIYPLAPSVNKARLSDAKEVKTMANCSACNKKADNGVFSKKKRLKYLLMVLKK
ncbi:MAG: hypothetical protein MR879_00270, partial [Campylobacter sp.]|nr:hypothetical protein [Campylobacter sp.]